MTVVGTAGPMLCFDVEVRAVRRLSRGFVRITFGGDCLVDFAAGGPLGPRDQRVKLLVPRPGGSVAPVEDLSPGWYPRWLARDPAVRGEMRTYTVRAVRADGDRTEVDVDFVLHEPSGPAAQWAAAATPGDRIAMLGPNRLRADEYGGIEWAPPPPGDGPLLLVGDETAVPAIASILETLPPGYDGRAVVEVPSAEDFLDVRTEADIEVTWLARSTYPRGAQLLAAVRSMVPARSAAVEPVGDVDPDDLLWETPTGDRADGAPYAWIAGEAGVVRDLRRHLVGDAGLPRSSVAFMGYWREGRALG